MLPLSAWKLTAMSFCRLSRSFCICMSSSCERTPLTFPMSLSVIWSKSFSNKFVSATFCCKIRSTSSSLLVNKFFNASFFSSAILSFFSMYWNCCWLKALLLLLLELLLVLLLVLVLVLMSELPESAVYYYWSWSIYCYCCAVCMVLTLSSTSFCTICSTRSFSWSGLIEVFNYSRKVSISLSLCCKIFDSSSTFSSAVRSCKGASSSSKWYYS